MKATKLEIVLLGIPCVAFISLMLFLYSGVIPMESFWDTLTYFLLAGIFIPLATLITLRITKQHPDEVKKYDIKKLNDEVFRKLTQILCFEYFPYFQGKFDFCYSSKPIELDIWKFFEFHARFVTEDIISKEFESKFQPLKDVVPTMLIGENYLQKHYPEASTSWTNIKQELEKINKERTNFFQKVSAQILKELKKEFGSKPFPFLRPHGDGWAYFEERILFVLPILMRRTTIKNLEIDSQVENQSYILYSGIRLVGFNKLPEYAIEKVTSIINAAISDMKLQEQNGDFYVRLYELNTKLIRFSDEIQKKVVNDIDSLI